VKSIDKQEGSRIVVAATYLPKSGVYLAGAYLLAHYGLRPVKFHQTVRTSEESRAGAIARVVRDVIGAGPDADMLRRVPVEDRGRAAAIRIEYAEF